MSISANLHNISLMEAKTSNGTSWLTMRDGAGSFFVVYMPMPLAEQIVELFESYDAMCGSCRARPKHDESDLCASCLDDEAADYAAMDEMAGDDKAHAHADLMAGL